VDIRIEQDMVNKVATMCSGVDVQEVSSPDNDGAGIYCGDQNSPVVSNCVIRNNHADHWGGGLHCKLAHPLIRNCFFYNNTSGLGGGLWEGGSTCYPQIVNCVFTENTSKSGGGMCNDFSAFATLINCTFNNNKATGSGDHRDGGGVLVVSGEPEFINTIVWGNEADDAGDEVHNHDGEPAFSFCDIKDCLNEQGNWDTDLGLDKLCNIDADPKFVDGGESGDPDGADNKFCTVDDGLRLSFDDSPCIDAADGDAAPITDITVYARIDIMDIDNIGRGNPDFADMGAYEALRKYVHFTGALMGGEFVTEHISKTFAEDIYSDFLPAGDYPDTETAIPDAVDSTLDGIAIPKGKRVIIYSGKNFLGDILLDKTGPAIINNVHWKYDNGSYFVMTEIWTQPLQREFRQSVREWSDTDMYDSDGIGERDYWWGHGSVKIKNNP